ncbi:hypothetical protein O0I10_013289 [Lichtheimia ornata]|uniref:CCHC-type domain-containing protein n=1 Tax=Lichtheimia ornata TaxID=688661 RepID=A0AAD7URL0_9FUNG|nr:uncharacterized protein O0I10_013289 [Lichtheimia ornata]KAJ8651240.1 hypothetical protein O0I10_013289 [Lichtheimia ornata]
MEEDFYTRIQAEGEPGESYIHAKIQLWRRLQLNQQEVTNPDISAIRIGLRPHNEFFLNLKKPKNIEELRETVRLADKCRANPSVIPSIVQPMTNVANPSHQEEPRVQIVHNTQRQERKSLEARMDSLMQQMESLVVMQQKVLETVADRPRSSSRASGGGFKPVCFNCHKQGHYMDQCRSECGGCGASGHVISHCSSSKGQSSNVYNPATQRNLVSEAIKRNGDTGPEKQDFLKGGH